MTPRVAAVIVTWNRLGLLRRLVRALEDASVRPDVLVVVDNASDDGTAQWLGAGESVLPMRVVSLAENTGGAGGFHEGIRAALDEDADLLWLMDDDGLPTPDCLERLLERRDEWDLWGPLVVAEDDPARLCFPIRLPGRRHVVRTVDEASAAAGQAVIADV
ncbi:MAG TPA: glycosyltransferase, partial [Nocardioides sp.]|nr:glycosyltransferase [Nocardioides sp.]